MIPLYSIFCRPHHILNKEQRCDSDHTHLRRAVRECAVPQDVMQYMTKFWFYHCVRLVVIGLHIKLYYLRTKLVKAATVTSIEDKPNRRVYVLSRFLDLISAASDVTQWPSTVNLKLSPSYRTHLQETCTKLPAKSFKFGVILLSPLYTSDRVNPVCASKRRAVFSLLLQ